MPDFTDQLEEEFLDIQPQIGPFFKFPDKETFLEAARSAGFVTTSPVYDEDGNETGETEESIIAYTHTHSLDVIGIITKGGEWDEEGNVITPPETLDGWHINYQGDLPEGWEQYAVHPKTPVRTWW